MNIKCYLNLYSENKVFIRVDQNLLLVTLDDMNIGGGMITNGNVIIDTSANIILKSDGDVFIKSEFEVKSGASFEIKNNIRYENECL